MTPPVPAIRPISDLRTQLNDVCDKAHESQQPIFMTKNGSACLVVMDCEAYERQRQHERYVLKLREAEIEARYKQEPVTMEEMDARVGRILTAAKEASVAHA